jgi:hypothetical protein
VGRRHLPDRLGAVARLARSANGWRSEPRVTATSSTSGSASRGDSCWPFSS